MLYFTSILTVYYMDMSAILLFFLPFAKSIEKYNINSINKDIYNYEVNV